MFVNIFINKVLIIVGLVLPLMAQATIIELRGDLTPANQNGSDPGLITDPNGIVPTTASGSIQILLDTDTNSLDFSLNVDGILQSELRSFGPNATPVHLHLAGGGNPGNFGPISVDLSLGADSSNFTDTATGFEFARSGVSILLEDQGNVALGMHPGNDLIVDALQSGNTFVLVHTTKDIFTNTSGPAPGFPFGEIRGNINPVPLPTALPLMITAMTCFSMFMRRSRS